MILVGITGIIGSGKSTATDLLREEGFPVIDLDRLAKESLSWDGVKEGVLRTFGKEYIRDGMADVERLRATVFCNEESLRKIEAIIHPIVIDELLRRTRELAASGEGVAIVDAPLLFEKGLQEQLNRVVVISASMETIRERLRKRGMAEEDMERRILFQIPLAEKEKIADYVVRNDGTEEDLKTEIHALVGRVKSWEVEVDAP
jgi:dephospho-CoA kinase